jgi:hypothetical protein
MRHTLKLLAALAVSLLVLGLLFQLAGGREELSPDRLRELVRNLALGWLLVGLVGTLVQAAVRAVRYGILLRAGGEPVLPPPGHLLLVTMTRNMFVDLLPARLGELSYVALLNRGFQLRLEPCLSSLSLSVLFDFAALLVLVGGLALAQVAGGQAAGWMAGAALVLALILAVGLLALFRGVAWTAMLVERLPSWRLLARLDALLRRLDAAFTLTRRAGVLGRVLGWSLLVRVSKYGGFYALFRAVTEHNFPSFAAASPVQVIGALLSAEGASSVPVPSFMSFGAYEAGGAAAWTALGFPAAQAALCMLVIHVVSQVVDYGLGGAALLALLLRRTPARPLPPGRGWMLAGGAALALAAAGFTGWQIRSLGKQGLATAPAPGAAVPAAPEAPSVSLPKGLVIWTSNRSGNHDLWQMSLPDRQVSPVTTHPHAEYHPRISPEGGRVVFARAQRAWVSQRNELDWDVVVRDLASGVEQVVATQANAPSWSGPDTVVFQAGGDAVVEHDLRDGTQRRLAEAGQKGVPAGTRLQTPSFIKGAPALAVTFRGPARGTHLCDLEGAVQQVGGGCQLGWAPDGRSLLLVDHGGRRKNAIFTVDPTTRERRLLFDAEEPWSHEYFPRLSSDGAWLVYGACAEGHEHDGADYEIFLWPVGTPAAQALRLTWHTGNDGWPDLWLAPGA